MVGFSTETKSTQSHREVVFVFYFSQVFKEGIMNVTPISGTTSTTPVQTNSFVNLITNSSTTNAPNNAQWLAQEAFMLDVINSFQNFGFNLLDSLGVNNTSTDTNPLLSTNVNLSESLNSFVFSLQSSLEQASIKNQEGTSNNNSNNNTKDQGFNNFANDLLLLSLLNNNNSSLTGNSTDINSNPILQSNFNNLLNLLLPLSPNVTTPPTLNDFFNMMLNNLEKQINNQNTVGTSISTAT